METIGIEELSNVLRLWKGSELEGVICRHPFYDRESPVIFGDHVTLDAGTGCVHTAPGHGEEDFYWDRNTIWECFVRLMRKGA